MSESKFKAIEHCSSRISDIGYRILILVYTVYSVQYKVIMFHGYVIVIATFLLKFVAIGIEFSAAVFLIPLQTTFDCSRAEASMMESVLCAVGLLSSMSVGTLLSFFANFKYCGEASSVKPVIATGGFCIALGSYLTSTAQDIAHVLLYAVVTGVGIGFTGYTCSGICVQFFHTKNRGQMLLLGSCGSGCGSYALTKIMGLLLVKFSASPYEYAYGGEEAWRIVIRRVGVLCGLVAILAAGVMRLPYPLEVEMHEDENNNDNDNDNQKNAMANTTNTTNTTSGLGLDPIVDDEEEEDEEDEEDEEEEIEIQNNEASSLHSQIEKQHSEKFYDAVDVLGDSVIDMNIGDTKPLLVDNDVDVEQTNERFALNRRGRGRDDHMLSFVTNRSMLAMSFFDRRSVLHHDGTHAGSYRTSNIFDVMGSMAEFESARELPIDRTSIIQVTKFETKLPLSTAIRTRTSFSVFSSGFFLAFGLMAFLQHLPAFAESIGLPEEDGTKILSLTGLAMIIGNIGFGFAVDCFGPILMLRLLLLTITVSSSLLPLHFHF